MRKRKINPQYLSSILSQDVKNEEIAATEFAKSLKRFADEYLGGIMELSVEGSSTGCVNLKLSVASYLMRLLCECGGTDELITATLSLSDDLVIKVDYEGACPAEDVAYIVKVARLAGFEVSRNAFSLIFKASIRLTSIMQVYATSGDDFFKTLVITYKM